MGPTFARGADHGVEASDALLQARQQRGAGELADEGGHSVEVLRGQEGAQAVGGRAGARVGLACAAACHHRLAAALENVGRSAHGVTGAAAAVDAQYAAAGGAVAARDDCQVVPRPAGGGGAYGSGMVRGGSCCCVLHTIPTAASGEGCQGQRARCCSTARCCDQPQWCTSGMQPDAPKLQDPARPPHAAQRSTHFFSSPEPASCSST
jgi:hypothetical protein